MCTSEEKTNPGGHLERRKLAVFLIKCSERRGGERERPLAHRSEGLPHGPRSFKAGE